MTEEEPPPSVLVVTAFVRREWQPLRSWQAFAPVEPLGVRPLFFLQACHWFERLALRKIA